MSVRSADCLQRTCRPPSLGARRSRRRCSASCLQRAPHSHSCRSWIVRTQQRVRKQDGRRRASLRARSREKGSRPSYRRAIPSDSAWRSRRQRQRVQRSAPVPPLLPVTHLPCLRPSEDPRPCRGRRPSLPMFPRRTCGCPPLAHALQTTALQTVSMTVLTAPAHPPAPVSGRAIPSCSPRR